MLKRMAVAGLGAALPKVAFAQLAGGAQWRSAVMEYLEKHERRDGGYAWEDQEMSHLTPTFAVIGCYRLLKRTPPRKNALAEHVRTHHPSRLKKIEQEHREFEYQQIQSLVWLEEDVSAFREQIAGWKTPTVYLKQYEQQSNPIFGHEVTAFTCRAWETAAQGQLKNPIAELMKLTVDSAEVSPQLVTRKGPRGAALVDHYHQFHLPNPTPGKHRATAIVRVIETGTESSSRFYEHIIRWLLVTYEIVGFWIYSGLWRESEVAISCRNRESKRFQEPGEPATDERTTKSSVLRSRQDGAHKPQRRPSPDEVESSANLWSGVPKQPDVAR